MFGEFLDFTFTLQLTASNVYQQVVSRVPDRHHGGRDGSGGCTVYSTPTAL